MQTRIPTRIDRRAESIAVQPNRTLPLSLTVIQLILAYEWLISALDKLLNRHFGTQLVSFLNQGTHGNPYGWFAAFLTQFVLPNHTLFAILVQIAEPAIAVTLVVSASLWILRPHARTTAYAALIACAALLGSASLSLNYFFEGGTPLPWINTGNSFNEAVDIDILIPLFSLTLLAANLRAAAESRRAGRSALWVVNSPATLSVRVPHIAHALGRGLVERGGRFVASVQRRYQGVQSPLLTMTLAEAISLYPEMLWQDAEGQRRETWSLLEDGSPPGAGRFNLDQSVSWLGDAIFPASYNSISATEPLLTPAIDLNGRSLSSCLLARRHHFDKWVDAYGVCWTAAELRHASPAHLLRRPVIWRDLRTGTDRVQHYAGLYRSDDIWRLISSRHPYGIVSLTDGRGGEGPALFVVAGSDDEVRQGIRHLIGSHAALPELRTPAASDLPPWPATEQESSERLQTELSAPGRSS